MSAGPRVAGTDEVCTACQLANLLATGVFSGAIDAGHSECEGEGPGDCKCGCDYSTYRACRECGRKGTELDGDGQCANRRDCANAILASLAAKQAERAARAAAAPVKRQRTAGKASKSACKCGCGTETGGYYAPGHDARHVSALTAKVKSGELTLDAALAEVNHSDKLVAKLEKACE